MDMRKILVTGGAGFIGSNLVHYLQNQSDLNSNQLEITVLDALTYAGNLDNLSGLPQPQKMRFVHGDVRDWNLVQKLIQESDEIFHLAAESHVDRSITNPGIFIETNVQGTLNILEASRKFSKRVVLVSTDEVYGSLSTDFADEDYPLNPSSPYSASKIAADAMAMSYFNAFDLPLVIARPFNTYGPRQSARAIIPTIISQIASGMEEVKIGGLTPTRDLNFV